MLKWILLALLSANLFSLEITLDGAEENFEKYSTLHIKASNKFLCQEEQNEYKEVTKIVCAFSKRPSELMRTIQNNFFEIGTTTKKKTFFLIIKPHKKMKLFVNTQWWLIKMTIRHKFLMIFSKKYRKEVERNRKGLKDLFDVIEK